MRFEVPQFIEIEDKIFGPFTWRQGVYLGGGIGLAVVLLFTTPFIIFLFFGVPIGGLAILLAFYPVNNRPFSIFLESVVHFYRTNRVYHWRKKAGIIYSEKTNGAYVPTEVIPAKGSGSLNSLARKLELNALQKES